MDVLSQAVNYNQKKIKEDAEKIIFKDKMYSIIFISGGNPLYLYMTVITKGFYSRSICLFICLAYAAANLVTS